MTGRALSVDFPVTPNAFEKDLPLYGGIFLTKLNPTGSALVYSTYLGGSGYYDDQFLSGDLSYSVAVDNKGQAYVTGAAYSHDFPVTPNAFQTVNNVTGEASTAFVTKFNPEGSALVYSTYLGGSFAGNMPDFAGAAGPAKVPQLPGRAIGPRSGARPQSTGVPPAEEVAGDVGAALALDASGNAYITGATVSADFPVTADAYQRHKSAQIEPFIGANAFVTKLDRTGSDLVYSTYLGGSVNDFATAIAVDHSGEAYVTGITSSPDFPTSSNAFQKVNNASGDYQYNGFVTKLNRGGSALIYSTFLGGHINKDFIFTGDEELGIALDNAGNAYVAGIAASSDFPVTNDAFQKVNNDFSLLGSNAVLTKLNANGSGLLYSTYLGGSLIGAEGDDEGAYAIAVDRKGNAYITGAAVSANFPVTPHAFQLTKQRADGSPNAFVSKFNF